MNEQGDISIDNVSIDREVIQMLNQRFNKIYQGNLGNMLEKKKKKYRTY